jgi:hypothetical protein
MEGMVGIAIMEQPTQFEMRLRSFLDAPSGGGEGASATAPVPEDEPAAAE